MNRISYFVEVEGYAYTRNGGQGHHTFRKKFDTIREGTQFLTDMKDKDKLNQFSQKQYEGDGYVQKVKPQLFKETITVEMVNIETNKLSKRQ